MGEVSKVLAAADEGFEASIARLQDFVSIKSVSTDPAYKAECRKAAEWLARELIIVGFDASLRETAGHPMVVGHYSPPDATAKTPHVLFYGHYDVQPADPFEKWVTPPFEATRKTGTDGKERLFGRGTADDKGQLMTFVEAARAWMKAEGKLPLKVTLLFEGEEESGSPSLVPFLKANKDELSHDVALVCDTNMWDEKTPAITTRLRGLAHEEVTIIGPKIDLHSGAYGGPVMNPIRLLTTILSEMHDAKGRVTIPGFYEGVGEPSKATLTQWKALKFSEKKFLGSVGLKDAAGERGRSVLEQIWSRPTAEVNGITGGYQGAGVKTVLPSQASAKLTFRLVGKQNPDKIVKAFRKFVKERIPKDCKASFDSHAGGSPASEMSEDNPHLRAVAQALTEEFGRQAMLIGSGGSIPIVRYFRDILGMHSVLAGFGLDSDAIHSPNEKYDLESYRKGIRSWARAMEKLA